MIRVYYLDDEENLCRIINDYFQSDETLVSTFIEADEAITACKENPPDIIFIDYRLPDTTGDEVATLIDQNIPKILVTGDLTYSPKYDFYRVVTKPYTLAALAALIKEVTGQEPG